MLDLNPAPEACLDPEPPWIASAPDSSHTPKNKKINDNKQSSQVNLSDILFMRKKSGSKTTKFTLPYSLLQEKM